MGESGDCLRLAVGAQIMEDLRAEVFCKTRFCCSAPIIKPWLSTAVNYQTSETILPLDKVAILSKGLPITKVRGLGELGQLLDQLAEIPLSILSSKFDSKTASWLHMLSMGRDIEKVQERELPVSIRCGKNFPGNEMLNNKLIECQAVAD